VVAPGHVRAMSDPLSHKSCWLLVGLAVLLWVPLALGTSLANSVKRPDVEFILAAAEFLVG